MENVKNIENCVSHETIEKLKTYEILLKKWQKAINLVSNNTIDDAWNRHILDSLQLIQHLPEDKDVKIIDLGSGAGFPGVVIAMCGYSDVSVVESDERKCLFMQEVAKSTKTKLNIINKRIENVQKLEADVITARALAKIDELLVMSKHLSKDNSNYLFLKGKTAKEEVAKAEKEFDFQVSLHQSLTSSEANIVKITHVKEKKS